MHIDNNIVYSPRTHAYLKTYTRCIREGAEVEEGWLTGLGRERGNNRTRESLTLTSNKVWLEWRHVINLTLGTWLPVEGKEREGLFWGGGQGQLCVARDQRVGGRERKMNFKTLSALYPGGLQGWRFELCFVDSGELWEVLELENHLS